MIKNLTVLSLSLAFIAVTGCQSVEHSQTPSTPNTKVQPPVRSEPAPYSQVPSKRLNALEMAKQNPDLSFMVELIESSGMSNMLKYVGDDYTIFVPSNQAFESLFKETKLTKESLLANKPLQRSLLTYHLLKGAPNLTVDKLQAGRLKTYGKYPITVTKDKKIRDIKGRTATIITPDIATTNGTVHVIDKVMLPTK